MEDYLIEDYDSFKQRIKALDNDESIKWHQRCESKDFSWISEDPVLYKTVTEYCHDKCLKAHEKHCKRQKIKEMFKDIDKEELLSYLNGEF